MQKVGLVDKVKNPASTLSDGEKQRLGIARALYKKVSILFADEPTASLDENNIETIIHLLQQFVREGGSVILATHNEQLAQICDDIILMSKI